MEIKIKSPRGVKLLTEQKYCIENIDVVPELQNKTVTPTDAQQVVTPDAEYAGLGSVTVEPGTVTADATATADDIRLGKTAYGADGKMTGTIADYDGSSEPTSGKSLFTQLVDKSITEVTADDLKGVINIRNYVFDNCLSLASITIPESVTSIGSWVFRGCGLNTISGTMYTVLAITPPAIGGNVFIQAKINKIIVPKGTSGAYKAAAGWSTVADYIEEAAE